MPLECTVPLSLFRRGCNSPSLGRLPPSTRPPAPHPRLFTLMESSSPGPSDSPPSPLPEQVSTHQPRSSPHQSQTQQLDPQPSEEPSPAVPPSQQFHPSPPAEPDSIRSLLRTALRLPSEFPWVSDFLFHEDAGQLDLPSLVSGIQKASAALLELFCDGETVFAKASGSHIETTDNRTPAPRILSDSFCLVPVLSRGNVTLGILVRQTTEVEPHPYCSYHNLKHVPYTRFAFDNSTTSLINVATKWGSSSQQIVSFFSHDVRRGRLLSCFSFKDGDVRERVIGDDDALTDIIDHLTACESVSEDRETCVSCMRPWPSGCKCSHQTHTPSHPLDFSVFARNVVLYAGTFHAHVRRWQRSSDGELTMLQPVPKISSSVSVSVNHESASDLCDLAISAVGEAGQGQRSSESENPLDLHRAAQPSKENSLESYRADQKDPSASGPSLLPSSPANSLLRKFSLIFPVDWYQIATVNLSLTICGVP